MTIKYADITIIINIEEEGIFSTLVRYIGGENTVSDKDNIIIEFDDGTICDTRDEYIDKKYKFEELYHLSIYPIITFVPANVQTEGNTMKLYYNNTLNFSKIFKNHKKWKNYQDSKLFDSSRYDMIYENINKKEILSILRLKSNADKPRFIIAYDSNILDKSNLIYLVDCIFKHKFS